MGGWGGEEEGNTMAPWALAPELHGGAEGVMPSPERRCEGRASLGTSLRLGCGHTFKAKGGLGGFQSQELSYPCLSWLVLTSLHSSWISAAERAFFNTFLVPDETEDNGKMGRLL